MKRRKGFTLVELLVVIAIIALLMSILMPALSKAKALARDMLCMNNVKNWGLFNAMYVQENQDYFYQGLIGTASNPGSGLAPNGFWYYALRPYYVPDETVLGPAQDGIKQYNWGWGDDILRCPIAMKPTTNPQLFARYAPTAQGQGRGSNIDAAWGVFRQNGADKRWCTGLWGSYASNQWVCDQPAGHEPMPQEDYWRNSKQKNSTNIPVLMCGRWPYAWQGPYENQDPPDTVSSGGGGENGMAKVCVNRHNGNVNGVFMDFVPRKVGLKELWTFKWHRSYKTNGPWTIAGGVQPDLWPQWMRRYKDF